MLAVNCRDVTRRVKASCLEYRPVQCPKPVAHLSRSMHAGAPVRFNASEIYNVHPAQPVTMAVCGGERTWQKSAIHPPSVGV